MIRFKDIAVLVLLSIWMMIAFPLGMYVASLLIEAIGAR